MALFREKIYGVNAKIETVSGTDSVPTGANALRLVGIPEIVVDYMDLGEQADVQTGILSGADDAAPVGRYGRLTIVLQMRPTGIVPSSSNLPEADVLLRASLLSQGLDLTGGAERVTYTTLDTGGETATLYCYSAGKRFKLVGCVARPSFSAEVYKLGRMSFEVTGKLAADPDEVALPTPSFNTAKALALHSAASAIGPWLSSAVSDPLMLLAASIDLGNVTNDLASGGATDGLSAFMITDRAPTQELTYHAGLLTSWDPFAQSKADGSAAVKTDWQVGNTQYNTIKFTSRWKPRAPREGSRNGVKTYTQGGPLRVGPGTLLSLGREFQISFQ